MPQPNALPEDARLAMRDGLQMAALAIGRLADACQQMVAMDGAGGPRMDLIVRRLEAIRSDLESRTDQGAQDALFIGLTVAQAGLSSVADSFGEMLEAFASTQPHEEPPRGTYRDEPDDGVAPVLTEAAAGNARGRRPPHEDRH